MYMEPIVPTRIRTARATNPVDLAIGVVLLSASAMLLLPSMALYAVYVAAALVARTFWKNPRAGR